MRSYLLRTVKESRSHVLLWDQKPVQETEGERAKEEGRLDSFPVSQSSFLLPLRGREIMEYLEQSSRDLRNDCCQRMSSGRLPDRRSTSRTDTMCEEGGGRGGRGREKGGRGKGRGREGEREGGGGEGRRGEGEWRGRGRGRGGGRRPGSVDVHIGY